MADIKDDTPLQVNFDSGQAAEYELISWRMAMPLVKCLEIMAPQIMHLLQTVSKAKHSLIGSLKMVSTKTRECDS